MATKKTTKKEKSKKKYGKWKKLDTSVLGTAAKGKKIREDEAAKQGRDISDEEALLFDVSEEEKKAIRERRPF